MSALGAPKGFEMLQFPTRGGKAADIYSQLGGDYFQRLLSMAQGGPQMWELEKYGQDVFNQQIAPGIASRYAGKGIGASSGMQNAIAGAGANLASGLAATRQDLMNQSVQNVLSLGNLLLGNPDAENLFQRKEKNKWLEKILGIGAPIAGAGLGFIPGFPGGPVGGAMIGNQIGQAFR